MSAKLSPPNRTDPLRDLPAAAAVAAAAPALPPSKPSRNPSILLDRPPNNHRLVAGPLYDTLEELESDLKSWAKDNGFAIVRCRSKSYKNQLIRVDYICVKGKVRPSVRRIRETSTQRVGCQWAVAANALARDNRLWRLTIPENCRHTNHKAVAHPTALAAFRELTDDMKRLIESMSAIPSIRPRNISSVLQKQFPDAVFIIKDITNFREKLRRDALKAGYGDNSRQRKDRNTATRQITRPISPQEAPQVVPQEAPQEAPQVVPQEAPQEASLEVEGGEEAAYNTRRKRPKVDFLELRRKGML